MLGAKKKFFFFTFFLDFDVEIWKFLEDSRSNKFWVCQNPEILPKVNFLVLLFFVDNKRNSNLLFKNSTSKEKLENDLSWWSYLCLKFAYSLFARLIFLILVKKKLFTRKYKFVINKTKLKQATRIYFYIWTITCLSNITKTTKMQEFKKHFQIPWPYLIIHPSSPRLPLMEKKIPCFHEGGGNYSATPKNVLGGKIPKHFFSKFFLQKYFFFPTFFPQTLFFTTSEIILRKKIWKKKYFGYVFFLVFTRRGGANYSAISGISLIQYPTYFNYFHCFALNCTDFNYFMNKCKQINVINIAFFSMDEFVVIKKEIKIEMSQK